MPFTVARPDGMTDAEFIWYSRRLSQQGANLGKLARVLEPATGRHWLAVWEDRPSAESFAESLRDCTGHTDWQILETNGGVSEGPLGPVLIHVLREGNDLSFAVNQLSLALLRKGFPHAVPVLSGGEVNGDTWAAYRTARGDLADLVQDLAPLLTGVALEELESLGYALLDDKSRETLVAVPPSVPVGHS